MGIVRSKSEPEYLALEKYIETKLLSPQANREMLLMESSLDTNSMSGFLGELESFLDADVVEKLHSEIFSDVSLPTIYDDNISFSIASQLINTVRYFSNGFALDGDKYGGFCCAPTGKVNAQAAPIRISESQPSKVFIIFESGLFTFVHGVISTIVDVSPSDLLKGQSFADWSVCWEAFKSNETNIPHITESAHALRKWTSFFENYNNRHDLSYVSMIKMGPNRQLVLLDMVRGCELFVTAHEYAHAIRGHQNASLNALDVEKEADLIGAKISEVIWKKANVNPVFAIAGIAVFLQAIEVKHIGERVHLPADERMSWIISSFEMLSSEQKDIVRDIVKIYTTIFKDLFLIN